MQSCIMSPFLLNAYMDHVVRQLLRKLLTTCGVTIALKPGGSLVPLSKLLRYREQNSIHGLLYADDKVILCDSDEALVCMLHECDKVMCD
mmetsp:Transcript_22557/g.49339  ORF Transcript_22557/g.49339 Transcript_22557/m.49339 type:complete len:90 (+) Transcript_22557:94-363(+)